MGSFLSDFAARGYVLGEMQANSDAQLLREYAEHGTEAAFAELVHRHTNLVFSAALRQVEAPDLAAEVAQCVFIGLAQGARSLSPRLAQDASLAGWLCRSARNVSLNHRRDEFRRHSRERLAMEDIPPHSETAPDWEQLRPVLDAAMSELDERDHDALVMRFFRNQDLRSVGRALGVSDDTAQKRVSRALDKLRELLTRRGITTTAGALSAVLAANAVQVAPAGLAGAISAAAALASASVNTTTTTAIAITKHIAMTTLQKALVTTTLAAALGTGFYEARRASHLQAQTLVLRQQQDALSAQLQQERDEAAKSSAAAQLKDGKSPSDISELLRLRAEVAKLRDGARELARLKSVAASSANDPTACELNSWLSRVKKLRDRVDQMPNQRIPEFQFLTDQDWLDAVKSSKQLETDADFAQALSALRSAARSEFASSLKDAISSYSQANNGQLPSDFSQLKPYFASSVDDSVLQGYQFSQAGTVASKPAESLIDQNGDFYSTRMQVTMNSVSMSTEGEDALHQAIQAFLAANNGQSLTDPSQLLPYVQTPAEQEALQKAIQFTASR
jgi:RNA polymerase sigma factor (sigma-70 family)